MLRRLSRRRASYRRINEQCTDKERDHVEGVPKGYVPVMVGREEQEDSEKQRRPLCLGLGRLRTNSMVIIFELQWVFYQIHIFQRRGVPLPRLPN